MVLGTFVVGNYVWCLWLMPVGFLVTWLRPAPFYVYRQHDPATVWASSITGQLHGIFPVNSKRRAGFTTQSTHTLCDLTRLLLPSIRTSAVLQSPTIQISLWSVTWAASPHSSYDGVWLAQKSRVTKQQTASDCTFPFITVDSRLVGSPNLFRTNDSWKSVCRLRIK
jgi:hypothetical protein